MPMASSLTAIRPPLKWAGGKRWQVPHLRALWAPYAERRLVEPFCGGLAVALGLSPERALLNDVNPHLINFYRWVQRGLRPSIVAMENAADAYYARRDRFNALLREGLADSEEAAALFYYLNRTGYNGLCRFNSRGEFNVPFGRYARLNYATDFDECRARIADWTFTTGDVAQLSLQPDDFVYADPPYDVEFTAYARGGFSWEDQQRTAVWLAQHPGPVILVNQATPRIDALYRELGYDVDYLVAPRSISSSGDRTPVREVIATRHL